MVDTFSWENLTARPATSDSMDGLGVGSLIVFAIMFLAIAALAIWPQRWPLRRHLGRLRYGRWLTVGAWIVSLGLICLIVRLIQIDPVTAGRPIWQVIAMLGIVAWLGWLFWMLRGEPARAESSTSPNRRPRKGGSYR